MDYDSTTQWLAEMVKYYAQQLGITKEQAKTQIIKKLKKMK